MTEIQRFAAHVLRVFEQQQEYFRARRQGKPGGGLLDECRIAERDLKKQCKKILAGASQPRLFDEPRPAVRNTDPDTSRDAYHKVVKPRITERHKSIALALKEVGPRGGTSSEIADYLTTPARKWARDSVSPRLPEMEGRLAIRTSKKRKPSDALQPQTVWIHPDYQEWK